MTILSGLGPADKTVIYPGGFSLAAWRLPSRIHFDIDLFQRTRSVLVPLSQRAAPVAATPM